MPSQHSYFHIRCRGQVVRQRSAKPSLPSSNLGGTSIVAADCISFAATFYALHEKSLLTHSVAAPLKTAIASLDCGFAFLVWKLTHSVRITQVNETRFSNSFIEKRVSSCIQSLEKSRLFFLSAELMRIKTLRI